MPVDRISVRGGLMACGLRAAVVAIALLAMMAVAIAGATAAEPTDSRLTSATAFLSPELRAEQSDDLRNRGMLWVEQGEKLFAPNTPSGAAACASCHGDAKTSMRSVATRLPSVSSTTGQLVNLEGRINTCRQTRQNLPPLAYESDQLLALTAYLTHLSKGQPLAVSTEGPARVFFERGQTLWTERQGQLNLACTHCHDRNVGRKLRGDTISSAVPTGYPAYRLEWQTLGSLHRRLRACQLGVRAELFDLGSPEYLALELYLKARANGERMEAPALRR
jgi:sulfur-oxidizing protein SoxA